jgi:hypothetical protein
MVEALQMLRFQGKFKRLPKKPSPVFFPFYRNIEIFCEKTLVQNVYSMDEQQQILLLAEL